MQVVATHVGFFVKTWLEGGAKEAVVYLNLLHHRDVPEAVARPVWIIWTIPRLEFVIWHRALPRMKIHALATASISMMMPVGRYHMY